MGKMDICQLCGKSAELQLSHIMPGSIYKAFKKTSATGRIRATNEPNLLIEDGLKDYLLCWNCEQEFSKWEGMFRNYMFMPLHEKNKVPLTYGSWLEKFAVSVSWRILHYYKLFDGVAHVPTRLMPLVHA